MAQQVRGVDAVVQEDGIMFENTSVCPSSDIFRDHPLNFISLMQITTLRKILINNLVTYLYILINTYST